MVACGSDDSAPPGDGASAGMAGHSDDGGSSGRHGGVSSGGDPTVAGGGVTGGSNGSPTGGNDSSSVVGAGGGESGEPCADEGESRCEDGDFETCTDGSWQLSENCSAECSVELGCVECVPDEAYCVDGDAYECTAAGEQGAVIDTCVDGCSEGACRNLCAEAEASGSSIGCEYWAADLDNAVEVLGTPDDLFGCDLWGAPSLTPFPVCYRSSDEATAGVCDQPSDGCPSTYLCTTPPELCGLDAQHQPFAISVTNPQARAVEVTLDDFSATTTVSVAAGTTYTLFPQALSFPDRSLDWTMQGKRAYRLTSDGPVVAQQFAPLKTGSDGKRFSSDSSLLPPRATFGTEYIATTWPTLSRRPDTNDLNGYITVVAWQDGTEVEVTPQANVRANGAIAAIAAGTPTLFTLDAFDVLNLEAVADGDLTGSAIRSDSKTFSVFAGHEAAYIPSEAPDVEHTAGPCCADHLEEAMLPTSAWGETYAVARSPIRLEGNSETDVIRVLAQNDATAVVFDPTPAEGACTVIGAGQFCEVGIAEDTVITANQPILIGHYVRSALWSNNDIFSPETVGTGDPSLSLPAALEQWKTRYDFGIPSEFESNYLLVTVPAGGTVELDGADVTDELIDFDNGDYLGGRLEVDDGAHALACSEACGLELYGYAVGVSYMTSGGFQLDPP
jgi:hypothetical protein